MRMLGSVVLLTGALSVGAYTYLPVVNFNHDNLANLVRIQSGGRAAQPAGSVRHQLTEDQRGANDLAAAVARNEAAAEARLERTFSPSSPQFARSVTRRVAATSAGQRNEASAWRAVVTGEPVKPGATASADYVTSVELARGLQRELKRVGCYEGDIDGDWRGASRRAMSAFLTKVNATLPTDRPDYILLTLLQGHADLACGVSCAAGQGVSSDGRCIPNMIVVHSGPAPTAPVAVAAMAEVASSDLAQAAKQAANSVMTTASLPAESAEAPTAMDALPATKTVATEKAAAQLVAATAPAVVVPATARARRELKTPTPARLAADAPQRAAPPAIADTGNSRTATEPATVTAAVGAGTFDAAAFNAMGGTQREPLPGRMSVGALARPAPAPVSGPGSVSLTGRPAPEPARKSATLAGLYREPTATDHSGAGQVYPGIDGDSANTSVQGRASPGVTSTTAALAAPPIADTGADAVAARANVAPRRRPVAPRAAYSPPAPRASDYAKPRRYARYYNDGPQVTRSSRKARIERMLSACQHGC